MLDVIRHDLAKILALLERLDERMEAVEQRLDLVATATEEDLTTPGDWDLPDDAFDGEIEGLIDSKEVDYDALTQDV